MSARSVCGRKPTVRKSFSTEGRLRRIDEREPFFIRIAQFFYRPILNLAMANRAIVLGIAVAVLVFSLQYLQRQRVLNFALNDEAQRPRAVFRVETLVGQFGLGGFVDQERDVAALKFFDRFGSTAALYVTTITRRINIQLMIVIVVIVNL